MSKTTRLVLLHRSEDIESGRKGVLSSALISELWKDYTAVLVPKSSARQRRSPTERVMPLAETLLVFTSRKSKRSETQRVSR